MTVLMFGWEFPPHISGGLGTACYGLSQSLMEEGVEILFVVPKAHGDEKFKLIDASEVLVQTSVEELPTSKPAHGKVNKLVKINVNSCIAPYTNVEWWNEAKVIQSWRYQFPSLTTKEVRVTEGKRYEFTGTYGSALLDEVKRYGEVAVEIAQQHSFDVIHAHDWLTYPAGIESKKVSGKPLVVHVHATEFDRAGEKNVNSEVFEIERSGMEAADKVIAVSQWTKDIIVSKYHINKKKVEVIHNGIIPKDKNKFKILPKISEHVVTFLGRITYQKGPQYFVDAARKVLAQFPNVHFVMAGSGDLLPSMIERVAQWRMSSHFHFTGFLRGSQTQQLWSVSDVYVMPSVSEPFGITPLEAAQAGVPVIVSNQSGVSEVMDHAIKVDFWDTDKLASAILNVLKHKSLSSALKVNSKRELNLITWNRAAKKVNTLYHELQQTK